MGPLGLLVYGAAYGALDAGCLQGSAAAPLTLSIQWGSWEGSVMAACLEGRFEAVGLNPQQDAETLNGLEILLQRGRCGVV